MRALLLPIGGAVWLACGSVVTATLNTAIRPEQGTVQHQPNDRNDEVTRLHQEAGLPRVRRESTSHLRGGAGCARSHDDERAILGRAGASGMVARIV